jgi:MFS family permease
MGGEWTSGAVLVAESWPDAHRGKALGLMQSAWSIGYALAALAAAVILPAFGWRVVFYIGLAPALLALWMRRRVDESPVWLASGAARKDARPMRAIFGTEYLRYTVLLTTLSLMALIAYWGLNLWIPAYLSLSEAQGGLGLGTWTASVLVVVIQAGTFFGYVSFGFVADRFGRRRSFVTYLSVAAVMLLVFASVRDPIAVAVFGPVTTFFATGFFSGFAPVAAELYPTAIRATAQGFTFNMGRIGSALAPFLIGSLAETRGFGLAFALLAVALLLGASTWIWLPETRGARRLG